MRNCCETFYLASKALMTASLSSLTNYGHIEKQVQTLRSGRKVERFVELLSLLESLISRANKNLNDKCAVRMKK